MAKSNDLTDLLKSWPYDPDNYVREIIGADGRPRLQVRFPMGVEQYELDGRPDGLRPSGHESYLHYYLHLREQLTGGSPGETFRLTTEDCDTLREEAMIYYYRYELLYQRKDYERVVRDTARNLLVFDLLAQHADSAEEAESMEIYRPLALRLHFAGRAMLALKRRRHDEALRQVQLGVARLRQLEEIDDPRWRRERRSAVSMLRRLERHITRVRPLSRRQRLQLELKQALDREDYEVAAKLRDRIAALGEEEAGDDAKP
jgi:hypothetical protein